MQKFSLRAAALAAALLIGGVLPARANAQEQQGARVVSVDVRGNSRVPTDQIMTVIAINAGDSVMPSQVDRAMRRLMATGEFKDVAVFAPPADSANPTGPVKLRFNIVEQPVVAQIEFRGLENMRASIIRDTVGLRAGKALNPNQIAAAKAMTRGLLAKKGFRVRSMTHRLDSIPGRPNEVALVFDIVEGERVAIAEVDFVGNEKFNDDELRGVMGTKQEGFLFNRTGSFDEDKLRDDMRANLPSYYSKRGYIDFVVLGDSLIVDPLTGKARLQIEVEEGQQYRLAEFDIRGASRFASEDLRRYFEQRRSGMFASFGVGAARTVGTQEGEVFDAVAFQDATQDVQRLYSNEGYLYAQVIPQVERLPGSDTSDIPLVRVGWMIQEGNPATIRRVDIVGNTFTHENVIRGQLLTFPGDVYSEERLIASYRRANALGFFESPMSTPQILPDEATGDVDIVFEVKEKQTGSVNFGTSLGGSLGLMGFLGYDQPNLFGQAKSGHLRWDFGKYSNNFEASYADPAINDSWVSGYLSLFSSTDRFYTFNEGRRRRTGIAVRGGLPAPWDPAFSRFTLGYSVSRTSYENFESGSENLFSLPPGVQSTVTFGLARMGLDHPMFPTVGSRQEFEASLNGGVLGGDGEFQKYTFSGAWYVPVGSLGGGSPGSRAVRFTLGLSMETGALFGDASRFPFDRFFMGGVQFGRPLRGYEETTVTPRGYISKDSDVALTQRFGDAYMRLSAEYAVRFTDNISLGLFYDAGNVWNKPSEMDPTRLLRGAGVGMTIVTPFGPLGLDYAYGFDKTKPGWQLHFKFGQGF